MDPGHKARKNPSDNADLGFQAVGPALRIMQLNVEGLSAAKRHIIQSLAEVHHIDVICFQETHVNDDKSDRLTKISAYEKKISSSLWDCLPLISFISASLSQLRSNSCRRRFHLDLSNLFKSS